MKLFSILTIALVARFFRASKAYILSEEIVGFQFLDAFDFQAIPDPTHGRV